MFNVLCCMFCVCIISSPIAISFYIYIYQHRIFCPIHKQTHSRRTANIYDHPERRDVYRLKAKESDNDSSPCKVSRIFAISRWRSSIVVKIFGFFLFVYFLRLVTCAFTCIPVAISHAAFRCFTRIYIWWVIANGAKKSASSVYK